MSMAVQLPHPLKSIEDDSAHICQPHIKNKCLLSPREHLQTPIVHLRWLPPLTSNTAAESCLAVPAKPRILKREFSSKACSTSTPTIIITRWLPVKFRLLQTPPTKVAILLLIIPQISSNYTPHPAWNSRIKGNDVQIPHDQFEPCFQFAGFYLSCIWHLWGIQQLPGSVWWIPKVRCPTAVSFWKA